MRRGGLMRARGSLVVFGWDGRDMYDSAVPTNLITTCCGVVFAHSGHLRGRRVNLHVHVPKLDRDLSLGVHIM